MSSVLVKIAEASPEELEQLGIGRDTVLISFAVLFNGFVLALSIAFGLGLKDVAREYLEKRLKKREGPGERHPPHVRSQGHDLGGAMRPDFPSASGGRTAMVE